MVCVVYMIQYFLRKVKRIPAVFYRRRCRFSDIFFIDIDENNVCDAKSARRSVSRRKHLSCDLRKIHAWRYGYAQKFFRADMESEELLQHDLTTGDRKCLTGFILLRNDVEDRFCNVFDLTAASERNLGFIIFSNIRDRLCAGDFSGVQILDEETLYRIGPQRTV